MSQSHAAVGRMMEGEHDGEHDDHSSHEMSSGEMNMPTVLDCLIVPSCIDGNYPLFAEEHDANMASSTGTSHAMDVVKHDHTYTLYMPDGYAGMTMATGDDQSSHDHSSHDHSSHDHSRQMAMDMTTACPFFETNAAGHADASFVAALPISAFCIDGQFPLYKTSYLANAASSMATSHAHAISRVYNGKALALFQFFMPNGVAMVHHMNKTCDTWMNDQSAAILGAPLNAAPPSAPPESDDSAAIVAAIVTGVLVGVVVIFGAVYVAMFVKAPPRPSTSTKDVQLTVAASVAP